jgi:hypothetical protein
MILHLASAAMVIFCFVLSLPIVGGVEFAP